jgi:ribosomal protein S18 acetylase RimI-like enzyme
MTLKAITSPDDIASAARLSKRSHERLRSRHPFLPTRSEGDFIPRIEWVTRKGIVIGLFETARLMAYLGAFPMENFRNAGPGSFGPDWCHAAARETDLTRTYRRLYRELAPRLISLGCRIHSFAVYSSESEIVNALELTGFGRIVMDAAGSTADLLTDLHIDPADCEISRSSPQDAPELSRLDSELAAHLAAAPVLMPNTRGKDSSEWEEWLSTPGCVAFQARQGVRVVGFIKAQEPQFDVSYAVHGESTLAINGMYVEVDSRCAGVGVSLLAHLVREAAATGKEIISVDCETTNPEAYSFWSRWFEPIAWGLERRV